MPKVEAIHSFIHDGTSRSRNATWDASEKEAEALRKAGLVRILEGVAAAKQVPHVKPTTPAVAKKPAPASKRAAKKPADPKPGQLTA